MVITGLTRNQFAGQPARGFESRRLRIYPKEGPSVSWEDSLGSMNSVQYITSVSWFFVTVNGPSVSWEDSLVSMNSVQYITSVSWFFVTINGTGANNIPT